MVFFSLMRSLQERRQDWRRTAWPAGWGVLVKAAEL
jgi:hypothetical protein